MSASNNMLDSKVLDVKNWREIKSCKVYHCRFNLNLMQQLCFFQAYAQTVETMNRLYNEVHLVHADLSEYNILWHEGQCW